MPLIIVILLLLVLPTRAQFGLDTGDISLLGNQEPVATYDPCVTSGLVTQIRFTEGTGTNANDSIGSADMDLYNTPTWVTGHDSAALSAINLDRASSQYGRIQAADDPLGNDWSEGTIALWVNFDDWNSSNEERLLTVTQGTTNYVQINKTSGNNLQFKHGANTSYVASEAVSCAGTNGWHHLAISWSETDDLVSYWFDGDAFGTPDAQTGTWLSAATILFLVGRDGGGNYCDVTVDDFRVYDRALIESELEEVMACD